MQHYLVNYPLKGKRIHMENNIELHIHFQSQLAKGNAVVCKRKL